MDSQQISDEAFWKKQEKRREHRLGQPCCTQSGMSWTMINMPGNFAVVVHGEQDCLNCFHHHTGKSSVQFYSTRLTDSQLTMGTTDEPLRQCLDLIALEERPDFILVLGTCPVEVIGSVFSDVVQEVSQRTGVPMIPLRTSGLRLSSQQEMLDWLYQTLVSLNIPKPPRDYQYDISIAQRKLKSLWKKHFKIEPIFPSLSPLDSSSEVTINLIGVPSGRHPEIEWICQSLGISVQASFPEKASTDDWLRMREAEHSFVVDPGMFPRLIAALESFDQLIHEIPFPMGLEASMQIIEKIAFVCHKEEQARQLLEPLRDILHRTTQPYYQAWKGKKFAVVTRMRNSYQLQSVSHNGLGHLPAILEMGMPVSLLIQGAPDPKIRDSYQEILAKQGFSIPFYIFSSPFELEILLNEHQFDGICVADQGRHAAHASGTPLIDPGELQSGLIGVKENAQLIEKQFRRGRV